MCERISEFPVVPVNPSLEKKIVKAFRLEKKESSRFERDNFKFPIGKILRYSTIMAGIITGVILGHLINPLIRNISDGQPAQYAENEMIQHENAEEYIQLLLADNGGDLW